MIGKTARTISRREFVGGLGVGASGLLGLRLVTHAFAYDAATPKGDAYVARALAPRTIAAASVSNRVLVVIELAGGNDGLSTLVPYGDVVYRSLRSATAIKPDEVIRMDDRFGLHPNLKLTAPRLAIIQGVGAPDANQSHFEMSARWWNGDASGHRNLGTGFLGRLCDVLDSGAPVTGVSLAGTSPALLSDKAVTMGVPSLDAMRWLHADDAWSSTFRRSFADLAISPAGEPIPYVTARAGVGRALGFGAVLDNITPPSESEVASYPSSALGAQLRLAATILGAGAGVRVVHVSMGGFDTHTNQRGSHDQLMIELDQALAAFAADIDKRNLTESVLVATTSEFGRRAKENDNGTDHGTASCALLLGPVHPGVHGDPPSLSHLDEHDNLIATATLEEYYATLAQEWFGIDAAAVLPSTPRPIAAVLHV